MSKRYNQICHWDVLRILISTSLDWMAPEGGVINLVNIASLLDTSRYQVKKCMDGLVRAGVAEYKVAYIPDEYETYPPYCGYRLTETIKYKGGDGIPDGMDRTYILQSRAAYQKRKAASEKTEREFWAELEGEEE